jgi:hypothetical protein
MTAFSMPPLASFLLSSSDLQIPRMSIMARGKAHQDARLELKGKAKWLLERAT